MAPQALPSRLAPRSHRPRRFDVLHPTHRVLSVALATACASVAFAQVTVTEFPVPTPSSRPYTITAGPDGNVWFTESDGNRLGRITPGGVITEFIVPTDFSGPYGIAIGAEGDVWFTERFGNQIGRFSPKTHQFTEYMIPSPAAQPWEIALGADGNLWFTEEDVNQIGRITPEGAITEFVPPLCCFPTGICAGADGNVWFTLEIGDQIGRVEPSGAMTMFPIPSVQVLPWDIAAGPDGGLWFSELAGLAIGRVSTGGQLVEHPVSGPFSGIAGVTAGPDGNLWFTRNDTDHVGSIDTAGSVGLVLDTGARPLSICLGPDGNLWFTEADANAIGRVDLARPGEAHVLSMDAAFAPRRRTVALGDSVQWTFLGPNVHSVADSSGLNLFDSGPLSIVSYFELACSAAGTFNYHDASGGAPGASITVPVDLPGSASVGVPFTVTWALAPFAGLVFDVQVQEPVSIGFLDWTSGTSLSQDYTPLTPGRYRFRARLRDPSSGLATAYSKPASVVAQ
jgi:streptogramin lyase